MITLQNLIVVTGGPGTGKTTLLKEIHAKGFTYIPEVARKIIQEQMGINGDALPWKNKEKYSQLMLQRSVQAYADAVTMHSQDIIFFDRGIPDTLAYCTLAEIPISHQLNFAVQQHRYNSTVFILPPWKEIYQTDNERKQDFEEAIKTFHVLTKTYTRLNYKLIEVPKLRTDERANFILQYIGKKDNCSL